MQCLDRLEELRGKKGVYILVLCITDPVQFITRHKRIIIEKGTYYYVGSAGGPGGLYGRLKRHLTRAKKKIVWHIDLLTRDASKILAIYTCTNLYGVEYEAYISTCIAGYGGKPIKGFGATDDPFSSSHLYNVADECRDPGYAENCIRNVCSTGNGCVMVFKICGD